MVDPVFENLIWDSSTTLVIMVRVLSLFASLNGFYFEVNQCIYQVPTIRLIVPQKLQAM